jgi:hypothetical protein
MENQILENYGFWALITLLVINQTLPTIARLAEQYFPDLFKRSKTAQEKLIELQEKELDLRERQISADEKIATVLILLQKGQENLDKKFEHLIDDLQQDVVTLVSTTNVISENIAVLMDRNMRLRTSDYASEKKQ